MNYQLFRGDFVIKNGQLGALYEVNENQCKIVFDSSLQENVAIEQALEYKDNFTKWSDSLTKEEKIAFARSFNPQF